MKDCRNGVHDYDCSQYANFLLSRQRRTATRRSWPQRLIAGVTCLLGFRWYSFPMEAVIDQAGRILLPKAIRDALGLLPGTKVDISPYGAGVSLFPRGGQRA